MAKIRHMYPGGNTCYGFHSFYDYIIPHDALKKIVLKGGPGVGKSTLLKMVGNDLSEAGIDLEYHWCSSDNDSLDGLVAGDQQLCMLDGTAPHLVDPRYPGAVDSIVNLGDFWDVSKIIGKKNNIIKLTRQKGLSFERAYNRLQEAKAAWWEWSTYYRESLDKKAVNRNILALSADFFQNAPQSDRTARHLFAAALTPGGIVNKVDSLIEDNWNLFAVKGSPGSGVKDLFKHIENMAGLYSIYAEIYHCPFDPAHIDLIIIPANKSVLLDISGHIADYESNLPIRRYKRMMDFDQLLNESAISPYRHKLAASQERFQNGLQEAIAFIRNAKEIHHELEANYVDAMDFIKVAEFRKELVKTFLAEANKQ
ncbi:MAG: PRK06851 family protein [Syntrophomonas sp.]|nr:PRK06851 family protein [Syntrophomonas sp.]